MNVAPQRQIIIEQLIVLFFIICDCFSYLFCSSLKALNKRVLFQIVESFFVLLLFFSFNENWFGSLYFIILGNETSRKIERNEYFHNYDINILSFKLINERLLFLFFYSFVLRTKNQPHNTEFRIEFPFLLFI